MTERKSERVQGPSRSGCRLQAVSCGLILLGFACGAAAQSGVPDLTGSWRNQVDPATAPAWQFTASNGLQTLDVSWMGSAATGHPDLRGSFSCTLTQVGGANVYKGTFQITEDAVQVSGTMSITIDSADQVEIDLQPNNGGAAQHYIFVRVAGAIITGLVLNPDQSPAVAALVGLCNGTTCVPGSSTSSTGQYSLTDVPDGLWGLFAYPPAGSTFLPSVGMQAQVTGGQLTPGTNTTLVLSIPRRPRAGVSVGPPLQPGNIGDTVVPSGQPLVITATGTPNCGAHYHIYQGSVDTPANWIANGAMTESPAGSGNYTATVPPLAPHHGPATVVITWDCHDRPDDIVDIYLDPSGTVKTRGGTPIQGATVTLLRSDTPTGTFTPVPNGNAIMSPANRRNPDTTDTEGQFHWDVIGGFYKVRAEKAGCFAPGNPSQLFVESAVLMIPPPVTNLDLRLDGARCVLEAAETSVACAGQHFPASVTTNLSKAETLINQAATTPGKKARKDLKKAKTVLRQAGAKTARAAKGKKATLSPNCAVVLEQAINSVRSGLTP